MHRVEAFDEIINNDATVHDATLTNVAKFQYLLARVTYNRSVPCPYNKKLY